MSLKETDILLVEDSAEDVELVSHVLRRGNLASNIQVARDGEEALDFLFCRGAFAERSFDHPPKIVLLDLKLPKVDGLKTLEQLKSDNRTRAIPVVILTSSNEESDVVRCYQLGVNSYIQKPVDFDQFRQTISTAGLYWMAINQLPPASAAKKLAGT
jgi:two-component system response regulator